MLTAFSPAGRNGEHTGSLHSRTVYHLMDRRGLDKAARVLEHCSLKGSNGKVQGVASARGLDERDGRREGAATGPAATPLRKPHLGQPRGRCQTTSARGLSRSL